MPNKKLKKTDLVQKDLVEKNKMEEEQEEDDDSSSGQEHEEGDDNDESMSSGDEDSNDDEDNDVDQNEEIMIDFEARAPLESDLQSVRLLVQQKLSAFPSLNLNDIARIIVQQENIGNVIYQVQGDGQDDEEEEDTEESKKAEEDETIFGVLSLIDLQSTQCKSFANTFTQFLVNECQKFDKSNKNQNKVSEKLSSILKTKRVSYIVNERFINVPPGISIPMFESLLSDLNGGGGDGENATASKEVKLNSDYWLFISKLYNECEDSVHGKSSKKPSNAAQQVIYANPEEEVFEEFSELKFEISYGDRASKSSAGNWSANDPDLLPILNVLLVPCDKVQTVLNKVKSLI